MRRSTTFAMIFLSLPLLAPSKPLIDNEGYAWLSNEVLGARATGNSLQLRIGSVQWAPAPSGGGSNELRMNDTAGGANASIETQRKDLVAQDKMGNAPASGGHSMLGASDRFAAPRGSGPGTLVVQGNLPGCTVGKRYGGMQFASGGMRYELKDVVISNCPTAAGPKEEITFVYGTVKVRGWDPKKKEN